jgi:hypothetical protein
LPSKRDKIKQQGARQVNRIREGSLSRLLGLNISQYCSAVKIQAYLGYLSTKQTKA